MSKWTVQKYQSGRPKSVKAGGPKVFQTLSTLYPLVQVKCPFPNSAFGTVIPSVRHTHILRVLKVEIENHRIVFNGKYIFEYISKMIFESKKFPKTFDDSKYGKMTEMTQIKYRFAILVEFSHNMAVQTGFENSTGNTTHKYMISYENSLSLTVLLYNIFSALYFMFCPGICKIIYYFST